MASYPHILQHTTSRFESPAKVFAKLKSKVNLKRNGNDGVYTRKAPLGNVKEKHGAEFKSPRKRTDSTWIADELKENRGYGSVSEAQPLTISPISSPQKAFGHTYSDRIIEPADDMPPFSERGHGCTPRKRGFLESRAVSQPLFMVNRKQILTEPPQMRDLDGFNVVHRTPAKIQAGENEFVLEEDLAPPVSSSSMFSPMRNKLRKRKLEPWGLSNVSSSTVEVASKPCVFGERQTPKNTCTEDLGNLKVFSAGLSEKNQFTHESMFPPPRSTVKTRCNAIMDKGPPMSPAKMFAYMKERESKAEQQEGRNLGSSARDLFGRSCHQSRDVLPSAVNGINEDVDSTSAAESVAPGSQSTVESADSQSDTDPSKDVLIPAVPSQPVLLEDPLILNSPQVSIPKKYEALYKPKNWPLPTDFPCESVIYLKRWFLRRNRQGLFVDGIHREENIPWNSNIISDRVSNCVLKTVTGRVYILVGKMNLHVNSGFPKWFLKKFNSGFPSNWKELYEKFLLESKSSRKTERNSKGRDSLSTTRSEANFIKLSSVKQQTGKPLKTPSNHPPDPLSSAKVSRSGRVIKPPLEYWKGGRVILDAQMNVTIHECYDTSICNPEVTTTVSARASQKPSHVFLPCNNDRQQCEPAGRKETSVPLRKVKSPVRRRNRATANHSEKPSHSPESPLETLNSSGDQYVRRTRSSQRVQVVERTLLVNNHPQKQTESSSTKRKSKKQKQDPKRPPVTISGRKRTVSASPASSGRTSNDQSSEEELPSRRTKRRKGVHKKKDEESHDSRKELRKTTRVPKHGDAAKTSEQKQSKSTKTPQPAKPTQSTKTQKADKRNMAVPPEEEEEEEDKWTEAELKKLKEAVALYPKHVSGYWAKVARIVGTRSAEECHHQHTSQGASQSPAKKAKKPKKRPSEAPKDQDKPVITARVGTFKRKQEVRQFLENMPRDNVDDIFSCSYMKNKRFEMPTAYTSSLSDDFALSDLEPTTPMSTHYPEVKTPQCLHITPGMIGSPNRGNDDKYVYQLQKRMKKSQFNVRKQAPKKNFTPTPSVTRTMKRCGNTENDTFVVWEMFPGKDAPLSDSEEEKDFYFSDND